MGALLARSRPFRALLVTVGVASLLVSATVSGIEALKLDPQQVLASWLGQTRAMVSPYDIPGSPPGTPLGQPEWLSELQPGAQLITAWSGQVPVRDQGGTFSQISYRELELPSPALAGNTELIDGDWPVQPGECVSTKQAADNPDPPIGEWSLTVTGRVGLTYYPGGSELICAPGTWGTWKMSSAENAAAGVAATPSWYLTGDRDAVVASLNTVVGSDGFPPATIETADDLLQPNSMSAQKFLGERLPFLVIPFALALVLAGLLGRWGGEVARALSRSGVPERPMRTAMLTTALGGSAAAGLVGGICGSLLGLALRPVLSVINGGVPLSPWAIRWADVVLLALMGGIGAAIGFLCSAVIGGGQLRQQDQAPRVLTSRASLLICAVSVLLAGAAVWTGLASTGRLSWMVAASVLMSAAMSALAIPALAQVGRRLSKRPISGLTLGGRILVEGSARWGRLAAVLTGLVSLVVSLFLMASASVAGQLLITTSIVPAGSAFIETLDPAGNELPADTLTRFETDLGVSDPVKITELYAVVEDWGLIQTFESLTDAKAVLGDLGPAENMLKQGGLVMIGNGVGQTEVSVDVDGDLFQLPVEMLKPVPASRYATGAGFAVRGALPEPVKNADVVRTWKLYRGLSPEQDVAARDWTTSSGMRAFQVMSFRPLEGFSLPAWIVVSLAGFGLLMTPLLASTLRKEARALRPLAANLSSIGVPSSWMRQSLRTLAGTVLIPSLALAVGGAAVVTAELSLLYPTAFDVIGLPWWMLAVFVCCLAISGYLGVVSSARRLYHKETTVTV
jgi:hypothetical protein